MTSKVELTDDQYKLLVHNRGGCTCFISPPCLACSEPPTDDELEDIGYEWPIDYMKHVRDMCK